MFRIFQFRLFVFAVLMAAAFTAAAAQTGGLKGKVRNGRGDGIPNAQVTVRLDGKDLKSVKANTKGSFTIDGLNSGVYNLLVEADGYSAGVLYNVEVKSKQVRDLGDRLMLAVDQGSQVIVKGSVFFKEGTSIYDAKVDIDLILADGSTKELADGTTSESGEFTYRRQPGPAKLRITAKYKGVTGSKDIEVETAAIYRLAITLDISNQQDRTKP